MNDKINVVQLVFWTVVAAEKNPSCFMLRFRYRTDFLYQRVRIFKRRYNEISCIVKRIMPPH
jgi:hypothetical protein